MIKLIPNTSEGLTELKNVLRTTAAKKIDNSNLFFNDIIQVRHLKLYKKKISRFKKILLLRKIFGKDPRNAGNWVYYPWLKEVHWCPPENIYYELLTARNIGLVSKDEQDRFYNFNVGIAGLSIGSSAVATILRGGGGKRIKLADFDIIEPTNLNRLRTGLPSVGMQKSEAISRIAYETNPYIDLITYNKGICEENISSFFDDHFKLDVVVDACDSFDAKILLRKAARERGVPVIMVTDLGDGTLFDIERYDLNPKLEYFHNRLTNIESTDFMERGIAVIGKKNIRPRIMNSLAEVGKTIPTHPQLGNSAYMSGVVISYIVRALANSQKIVNSQVLIDLDECLLAENKDKDLLEQQINIK